MREEKVVQLAQADTSERHYFEELRDKTFEKALADGMEIIIPTDRQLSLDIDRPWPAHLSVTRTAATAHTLKLVHDGNVKLISLLLRCEEEFQIAHCEAWRSSGGNCHVLLTLGRDLDPTTRIALQSMLGSDPMRELLNLRRVLCGADDPIALFRPAAIIFSASQLRGPGLSQESEATSLGKETNGETQS